MNRFLTTAEAAKVLNVSEESLRKGKAGTKTVPRIKMGGKLVFSARQLDEWMAKKERAAERAAAARGGLRAVG